MRFTRKVFFFYSKQWEQFLSLSIVGHCIKSYFLFASVLFFEMPQYFYSKIYNFAWSANIKTQIVLWKYKINSLKAVASFRVASLWWRYVESQIWENNMKQIFAFNAFLTANSLKTAFSFFPNLPKCLSANSGNEKTALWRCCFVLSLEWRHYEVKASKCCITGAALDFPISHWHYSLVERIHNCPRPVTACLRLSFKKTL